MSGRCLCLSGVVLTVLALGAVHGQGPAVSLGTATLPSPTASLGGMGLPSGPGPGSGPGPAAHGGPEPPPAYNTPPADTAGQTPPPVFSGHLSSWLVYPRSPGCCGPVGSDGPIGSEVYLRSGIAFNTGGGIFADVLDNGWMIQGGGRVLFFNPAVDSAWTVDLGITNVHYTTNDSTHFVELFNVLVPGSTTPLASTEVLVAGLNLTFVNATLGREWYLLGTADCARDEMNWRWGVDAGGRYGTGKVELRDFRHRTDVVGGVVVSVHSDLEMPCGCCILQAGIRGEYTYTWNDLLQSQNPSDVQSFNLLFTLGTRF